MPEKKKIERRMTVAVPGGIADEIQALSQRLGMQQKVVKDWVADAAFAHVTHATVKGIVHAKIAEQLGLDLDE